MADNTAIEWCDATWNPIRARNRATGKVGWYCMHESEGCRNCYAETFNRRLGTGIDYRAQDKDRVEIFLDEKILAQPLHWKRPRKIFPLSMSDLFGDFVSDEIIFAVLAAMAATYDVVGTDEHNVINAYRQRHTYQVLTKRASRMRKLISDFHAVPKNPGLDALLDHPFSRAAQAISRRQGHPFWMNASLSSWQWVIDGCPGLWLGVSAEDQARADERIPELLATPAAKRFVSAEPLLGPVRLKETLGEDWLASGKSGEPRGLDWVIAGGESGPGARPMHPDWPRALRDQCAAAGVPFFFKQHGDWIAADQAEIAGYVLSDAEKAVGQVKLGKKAAGALLDGREHREFPI